MIWIKMFSGLLLVRKHELCDLYKTIFLELEIIKRRFFTKSRIFCEKRYKLNSEQVFPKNAAPPSWF